MPDDEAAEANDLSEGLPLAADGSRSAKKYIAQFFKQADAGDHVDEATEADDLSERIRVVAEGNRSAKKHIAQFFKQANAGDHVSVASCAGGTQQIFNRLAQDEVQRGKDLAILWVKKTDNVEGLVDYIEGAFRGDRGEPRVPAGPIGIAQENDAGKWTIRDIVAKRDTKATQLVKALYEDVKVHNPFGDLKPKLPDDAKAYRVVLDDDVIVSVDSMETFSFKTDLAEQPVPGDAVVFVSGGNEHVVGLGQVDRIHTSEDSCLATLRHVALVEPSIPLAELPE